MKVYLLVCEEQATLSAYVFIFVRPFGTPEKAREYAKDHSDFILGYEADMDWIQSNSGTSWRSEMGSRIYTISESELDQSFNE